MLFLAKVPHSVSNRQNAVPVLHVEGTHYEVGFMVVSIVLLAALSI